MEWIEYESIKLKVMLTFESSNRNEDPSLKPNSQLVLMKMYGFEDYALKNMLFHSTNIKKIWKHTN